MVVFKALENEVKASNTKLSESLAAQLNVLKENLKYLSSKITE